MNVTFCVNGRYHRVKRKAEKRAAEKRAEEDPQAEDDKDALEKVEKLRAEVIIFLLFQCLLSSLHCLHNFDKLLRIRLAILISQG